MLGRDPYPWTSFRPCVTFTIIASMWDRKPLLNVSFFCERDVLNEGWCCCIVWFVRVRHGTAVRDWCVQQSRRGTHFAIVPPCCFACVSFLSFGACSYRVKLSCSSFEHLVAFPLLPICFYLLFSFLFLSLLLYVPILFHVMLLRSSFFWFSIFLLFLSRMHLCLTTWRCVANSPWCKRRWPRTVNPSVFDLFFHFQ